MQPLTMNCVLYVTDEEAYGAERQEFEDFSDKIIETVQESQNETR